MPPVIIRSVPVRAVFPAGISFPPRSALFPRPTPWNRWCSPLGSFPATENPSVCPLRLLCSDRREIEENGLEVDMESAFDYMQKDIEDLVRKEETEGSFEFYVSGVDYKLEWKRI